MEDKIPSLSVSKSEMPAHLTAECVMNDNLLHMYVANREPTLWQFFFILSQNKKKRQDRLALPFINQLKFSRSVLIVRPYWLFHFVDQNM